MTIYVLAGIKRPFPLNILNWCRAVVCIAMQLVLVPLMVSNEKKVKQNLQFCKQEGAIEPKIAGMVVSACLFILFFK